MNARKKRLRMLMTLGLLTVVVVLLQLLGSSIRIGEFSISLILLPVVVGAVLCGPLGGAWLGFAFGIVLMLSGEVDVFYAISPLSTLICAPLRAALAGLASGLVYSSLRRKKEDLGVILASVAAPIVNTCLFIVLMLLFFYDFMETAMGSGNVLSGLIKEYVSINFLIELSLSMVLTPVLVRLAKFLAGWSRSSANAPRENRKKLASRLTITVILLGLLICSISSGSGYRNFKHSMEKQYNDTAYQIAQTAASYLDQDLLRAWKGICSAPSDTPGTASIKNDEAFQRTRRSLDDLCNAMEADCLQISLIDKDILLADPAAFSEGEWLPLTCLFHSGDSGAINEPTGAKIDLEPGLADVLADCLITAKRPASYLISATDGVEKTTAILGVYDDQTGEPLAAVIVSVPMGALGRTVRSDIAHSIAAMICFEIIFITLYFYYISYRVIEPIKVISGEVSSFVENETSTGDRIKKINTQDEIQQLASDIVKMEDDIGSYIAHITSITAERERIQAELNVGTKIQRDMLPSVFPAFPDHTDFDIFASMDPAKEVGGDFYDFFLLDDDHLALVIADVSDKGVPAALFMVVAKTLLKNQASFTSSPKEILEAVNDQLCQNNTSKMFVTVWLCIYEISTGKCVASNAGHEYPAIRKANGSFELLKDRHGFVLGGIKNMHHSEYEFELEKGGTLFVYTDGVPEASNEAEEMFGTTRMIDALNLDSSASPADIISNTKNAISRFVGEAPRFDDITMLCIKRT